MIIFAIVMVIFTIVFRNAIHNTSNRCFRGTMTGFVRSVLIDYNYLEGPGSATKKNTCTVLGLDL